MFGLCGCIGQQLAAHKAEVTPHGTFMDILGPQAGGARRGETRDWQFWPRAR